MTDEIQVMIPALFGAESVIKEELKWLGVNDVVLENGRAFFPATWKEIFRLSLWLRTAERLQVVIGSFAAPDFDALFEGTKALNWGEFIPSNGSFPVNARSSNSKLHSEPAIQRAVKKAVVDSLKNFHKAQTLSEQGESYPIQCTITRDQAVFTIDTTGDGLHRRGYRLKTGDAPLKETLAASILFLSGWDFVSPLYDPCCGSGTILIEAAMMALNIAPGINRKFLFENWNVISPEVTKEIRQAAKAELNSSNVEIIGGDIDDVAIAAAQENSSRLGIKIAVKREAVSESRFSESNSTIISNPPYGVRMGDEKSILKIYSSFKNIFRRCKDSSLHLLTSDQELDKKIGLRAHKRRKLSSGGMTVNLCSFMD